MLDLCKGRGVCRGSTPTTVEMNDDGTPAAAGASHLPQGCGHIQPKLRRVGLVLHLEYPEGKEEQVGGQILSAQEKSVASPRVLPRS